MRGRRGSFAENVVNCFERKGTPFFSLQTPHPSLLFLFVFEIGHLQLRKLSFTLFFEAFHANRPHPASFSLSFSTDTPLSWPARPHCFPFNLLTGFLFLCPVLSSSLCCTWRFAGRRYLLRIRDLSRPFQPCTPSGRWVLAPCPGMLHLALLLMEHLQSTFPAPLGRLEPISPHRLFKLSFLDCPPKGVVFRLGNTAPCPFISFFSRGCDRRCFAVFI